MKYLSVCDGIGAAHVAFSPLGWECIGMSEIDAHARSVLSHHWPDTPLHSDFTALHTQPWIADADLLCGGTPCQAFSVAGNRQSLADDRGNLTLQFALLADAIDHLRSTAGREPAWILWENVPGILSTNDNAFGCFLGALVGSDAPIDGPGGGSWQRAGVVDGPRRCAAWRVLDARYFGVAQRRERVFVLALGGAGRWAAADALLPVTGSSAWHPAPVRHPGHAGDDPGANVIGTEGAGTPPIVRATGQANAETVIDGEPSITRNHEAPIVMRMRAGDPARGGQGPLTSVDQALTLTKQRPTTLYTHAELRRFTCTELERLQGFPDGHTAVPHNGRPMSDTARQGLIGNSWAVPVARWAAGRIDTVTKR